MTKLAQKLDDNERCTVRAKIKARCFFVNIIETSFYSTLANAEQDTFSSSIKS